MTEEIMFNLCPERTPAGAKKPWQEKEERYCTTTIQYKKVSLFLYLCVYVLCLLL